MGKNAMKGLDMSPDGAYLLHDSTTSPERKNLLLLYKFHKNFYEIPVDLLQYKFVRFHKINEMYWSRIEIGYSHIWESI